MSPGSASMERYHLLLADRAGGEPLTAADEGELKQLRARHPGIDEGSFEHAAAALHLALIVPHLEELPERVRHRLRATASSLREPQQRRYHPFVTPWPGWVVAAAVIAFLLLQPRVYEAPASRTPPSLEEVQRAADLVTSEWTATEDPSATGASGEVFWSNELQAGYMRLRSLARNDPSQGQYQLWIFDSDRPAEHPVDGGAFDSSGGETLVPIDAKLAVSEPTLFAITFERPGVVVSSRERLLLTGTPQ